MADARVLRELAEEVEGLVDALDIAGLDDLSDNYRLIYIARGLRLGDVRRAQTALERIRALAADLEGTDAPTV